MEGGGKEELVRVWVGGVGEDDVDIEFLFIFKTHCVMLCPQKLWYKNNPKSSIKGLTMSYSLQIWRVPPSKFVVPPSKFVPVAE